METTLHRAFLALSLLCVTGCSTTVAYRPQGLSKQEYAAKQNDLKAQCQHLRMGSYVNVKFYPEVNDSEGKPLGDKTGYFYIYDKMMDMLALTATPPTYSDRGNLYSLQYVQAITAAQETALAPQPNIVVKAVQAFLNVDEEDPEHQLLTK